VRAGCCEQVSSGKRRAFGIVPIEAEKRIDHALVKVRGRHDDRWSVNRIRTEKDPRVRTSEGSSAITDAFPDTLLRSEMSYYARLTWKHV
jgi:hypothetical protein